MQIFTSIFLSALLLTLVTRVWLSTRHIHHILAHRDTVPDNFASEITLESHQKAADYTCAKTRLGYVNMMLGTALVLVLTVGGGLNVLSEFWAIRLTDPLIHGMALILSTVFLMSLV